MTSRTLEGVAGRNWIYIIYVVQNWKTGEASGRTEWNPQLSCIGLQDRNGRWSCECVKYICRAGWEPEAAIAVGVCRTGPCTFFWSMSCFPRTLVPKSETLHEPPNLQTCSVCQSPLSTPHPMVVFWAKVCMGSMSPGIYFCTTKSRMLAGQEGVCGESGVMERTSCALGGNSYWLWLQFVPWQPGSLASCFSCAECSACSCSHCILQDCIFFFFLNQRAASWCCWSHPQQQAQRPAHTLHNTPSLSHSILALIKTLSF